MGVVKSVVLDGSHIMVETDRSVELGGELDVCINKHLVERGVVSYSYYKSEKSEGLLRLFYTYKSIDEIKEDVLRRFVLMDSPEEFETVKGSGLVLGIANGYFAGTAWVKGDDAFEQVSGRSFGIITGDDNGEYRDDKGKMNRVGKKELLEHLQGCCDEFRIRAKRVLDAGKIIEKM